MFTALVMADTTAGSARFVNVGILLLVIVIAWPLFRRFRKSVSENRKKRWVEQGLMDPQPEVPEPGETTDRD